MEWRCGIALFLLDRRFVPFLPSFSTSAHCVASVRGCVSIFPTISFPSRKHRNSQKAREGLSRSSILYYALAPPRSRWENSAPPRSHSRRNLSSVRRKDLKSIIIITVNNEWATDRRPSVHARLRREYRITLSPSLDEGAQALPPSRRVPGK